MTIRSRPVGGREPITEKDGRLLQTIRTLVARHRLLLTGLLLAVITALVLAWAGYDLSQRVDGEPVYQIINDTYSRTVELPSDGGLVQALPVQAGQELYGMRLNLTTYDHAFATGQLHTELIDDAGQVLARGSLDCITLKDNTFAAVIFEQPYTPTESRMLYLHVWYDGTTDADAGCPIGLWASDGTILLAQEGYPADPMILRRYTAQDNLNATAAVQYVVDYSGHWSRTLSMILGLLIFVAVLLGFVLLMGQKAFWAVVLVCGALLGGAFSVVTPPLVGPDEYTHMANSYQAASELLGQPLTNGEEDGWRLLVRSCDAPYFTAQSGDIGIFAYKEYLSHLGEAAPSAVTDTPSDFTVGGSFNRTLYLGQTLGVALARALGRGFHAMLLAGRLGNLVVYLVLAALAVALMPGRWKGLLTCVALLPQTLQLAASFSADATVLGLVFCFTALCFALRQRPARRAELVLLAVLAFLIGPAKAIYLPVPALVLMVPAANLDPRRHPSAPTVALSKWQVRPGILVKLLALVLAVLGWVNLNLGALLYATRDVDNVGLTRAAVAVIIAAALLGFVYWKIHSKPQWRKAFFGVLIAGLCVVVPVMFWRLTHMWGGLTPEQLVNSVQANGDSIYTYSAGYICRNLPGTIKLLLRSVSAEGADWLQGLLGTALGEPIVYPIQASWLLGVGLVLTLLAVTLPQTEEPALPGRVRAGGWVIVAIVVGLTFFAALSWTPINYTTIFGVQGRYWLPVLPLALVLLGSTRTFSVRRSVARPAAMVTLCLTSLVLLQGAGLYAQWQMT